MNDDEIYEKTLSSNLKKFSIREQVYEGIRLARDDEHIKVLQNGFVSIPRLKEIRENEREETLKILKAPATLEALAYLEHDRWSRWEKYVVEIGKSNDYGYITKKQEGWKRKRELTYNELTEKEKKSDRVEARKTLDLILKLIT